MYQTSKCKTAEHLIDQRINLVKKKSRNLCSPQTSVKRVKFLLEDCLNRHLNDYFLTSPAFKMLLLSNDALCCVLSFPHARLTELTQGYLFIFLIHIGACSRKSDHALCNQQVVPLDEHHTILYCVRVDLDPYTYLFMQQCVPCTCIPHICWSTQLNT